MLTALHIQDFLLIDQLSLPLAPGLTALTGETGAGKSILLDALGLACGARATRAGVRAGASQGIVTVAFDPPAAHPVWTALKDNGFPTEDDQVILRRVQSKDGRGRGFINDQPVSIAMLRTVGEWLLEIHGQHDGRGFLTASTHRDLLDGFGHHDAQVDRVRGTWTHWQEAVDALEEKQRARQQAEREADYLRHVVAELDALAPQADEESTLAARRAGLMAAEKIQEDVRDARNAIDNEMLEQRVIGAMRALERASAREDALQASFAPVLEKLDNALSELMEARAQVNDLGETIDTDPESLSDVEERLFALRAAARKHGVPADQLPALQTRFRDELDLMDAGEAAFAGLEAAAAAAKAAYSEAAAALSRNRHKIAAILDRAIAVELAPLKLGNAMFKTDIATDPDQPGASGIDHVEFMVATNPGAPMGPLKTIASGGELSRFVLAMKAALAAQESRTVIIFDEVDAGVGGAVADAVGERLARLARDTQVLVVTHSPQVAARADTHWLVEKTQGKNETQTRVRVLEEVERVDEIARMLSGATVTPEARAAAQKLLGAASGAASGPAPSGHEKGDPDTPPATTAKPSRRKSQAADDPPGAPRRQRRKAG